MAEPPVKRHMKFPYTFTACIVQFPYKHYYKHSWVMKYMCLSIPITAYVFYKIQKLSYNPANVERWKEIDRKAFSGEEH